MYNTMCNWKIDNQQCNAYTYFIRVKKGNIQVWKTMSLQPKYNCLDNILIQMLSIQLTHNYKHYVIIAILKIIDLVFFKLILIMEYK